MEELYERHDKRVAKMKDLVLIDEEKQGDRTDLSDWERMTDGDEV